MASVDMNVNDLRTYRGSSSRPADFDAYWNTALAELDTVAPNPTLEPADFTVPGIECFDLTFDSVRGARIHAKYLRPANAANCPLVLLFHGYGDNSGQWYDKLAFVSSGFCVAAIDLRGQSHLSKDGNTTAIHTINGTLMRGMEREDPQELYYRHTILDTVQLARVAMAFPETDETRTAIFAGAQGGGLGLICAALVPQIRRVAAIEPWLCDFARVWELGFAESAYGEIQSWINYHDPFHEHKDELLRRLGYLDALHHAPNIKADTLIITGLLDTTCPPSTQFAVYNALTCQKQHLLCPDHAHFAYRYVPEYLTAIYDRAYQYLLQVI